MSVSTITQFISKLLLCKIVISSCLIAQQYGHWEIIDSMDVRRFNFSTSIFSNNMILATGGDELPPYKSAEIYNVSLNIWNLTDSMHYQRGNQKMVLLKDGRILVISGYNQYSCEIYDPVNSTWEITDSLNYWRDWGFTASVLENGDVIVVGGVDIETNPPGFIP